MSDHTEVGTGIFHCRSENRYYGFFHHGDSISMQYHEVEPDFYQNILRRGPYSEWITRHGLGTEQSQPPDLFFRGLKIPVSPQGYSHAVGPIHASIIEPGHFRFALVGENIQSLNIRLGFQHRGILNRLEGKSIAQAMPIFEAISSDTTATYAVVASEVFEKSMGIDPPREVRLLRRLLIEIERMAIHVGDLGAMAGDIGYYPLQGVCANDRGAALAVMEVLTGSRFGKGAIWPGHLFLNPSLTALKAREAGARLSLAIGRVREHFHRAVENATIRERLQHCGRLHQRQVIDEGFVGMVARCTGLKRDLRRSNPVYKEGAIKLDLDLPREELNGDAWARFYLRFLEIERSHAWVSVHLQDLAIPKKMPVPEYFSQTPRMRSGVCFSAAEGWRGDVLIALDLAESGIIRQAYVRDPSVPNWRALEIAVRDELIGDFPLNNKSFNLSYVGFDL